MGFCRWFFYIFFCCGNKFISDFFIDWTRQKKRWSNKPHHNVVRFVWDTKKKKIIESNWLRKKNRWFANLFISVETRFVFFERQTFSFHSRHFLFLWKKKKSCFFKVTKTLSKYQFCACLTLCWTQWDIQFQACYELRAKYLLKILYICATTTIIIRVIIVRKMIISKFEQII